MAVNKVILVGRLGQNPEVRYTPAGSAVANFSIATNEAWTDKSGQKQERTEWHKIVTWGKTAELCGQYLAKGRQVYVEGRLQTRQWQDKEGQTRYTTEVQAQTVQFLGAVSGAGAHQGMESSQVGAQQGGVQSAPQGMPQGMPQGAPQSAPQSAMEPSMQQQPSFTEEDVPF